MQLKARRTLAVKAGTGLAVVDQGRQTGPFGTNGGILQRLSQRLGLGYVQDPAGGLVDLADDALPVDHQESLPHAGQDRLGLVPFLGQLKGFVQQLPAEFVNLFLDSGQTARKVKGLDRHDFSGACFLLVRVGHRQIVNPPLVPEEDHLQGNQEPFLGPDFDQTRKLGFPRGGEIL